MRNKITMMEKQDKSKNAGRLLTPVQLKCERQRQRHCNINIKCQTSVLDPSTLPQPSLKINHSRTPWISRCWLLLATVQNNTSVKHSCVEMKTLTQWATSLPHFPLEKGPLLPAQPFTGIHDTATTLLLFANNMKNKEVSRQKKQLIRKRKRREWWR